MVFENFRYTRCVGHLFFDENYPKKLIRYIHLNSVRADPLQYFWNGYKIYLEWHKTRVLKTLYNEPQIRSESMNNFKKNRDRNKIRF